MALADSISRLTNYYQRHGFQATMQRTGLFTRRLFSSHRFVLYYCDLSKNWSVSRARNWPSHVTVARVTSQEEIRQEDWHKIASYWNPRLSQRNFARRFGKRATAWLIWSDGQLAGYGWTLTGCSIEPYFFPLGATDVHLFDFLVFPEHRGKRINPMLVTYILDRLAAERCTRAFIDAAEWNDSQQTSLAKTDFQFLGTAHKVSFFGRQFVEWENVQEEPRLQEQLRFG